VGSEREKKEMDEEKNLPRLAKEIYLKWLCSDAIERQPRTQSELAQLLGIQLATLLDWKNSCEFTAEIVKELRMRYSDRLPALIDSLCWHAEKGDIRAINMLLHGLDFKELEVNTQRAPTVAEMLNGEELLKAEAAKIPSWVDEVAQFNNGEILQHSDEPSNKAGPDAHANFEDSSRQK
jgi:hypothetical protein